MDLDTLHHQADNLLAVGRCRLGRVPKRRQVTGQGQDSSTLVLAEARWLFLQKTIILFCKITPISQRFLPLSLQGASHETILRLNRLVLPFGEFCLIGGPLQAVLPVSVKASRSDAHPGSLSGSAPEWRARGHAKPAGNQTVHHPGFKSATRRSLVLPSSALIIGGRLAPIAGDMRWPHARRPAGSLIRALPVRGTPGEPGRGLFWSNRCWLASYRSHVI